MGKSSDSNDFYFLAIYDGHGTSGKDASLSCSDYVEQYLVTRSKQISKMNSHKKINKLLRNSFKDTEKKMKGSGIDYNASGTCCISVFVKN